MSDISSLETAALAILTPFTQHEESCVLSVYNDGYGNATIGWGSRFYANGAPVKFGDSAITQFTADAMLNTTLVATIRGVTTMVTVPLGANELSALSDLTYNIGLTAFSTSTLLSMLNQGDRAGAHAQFAAWNKTRHAGQLVVSPGLVARRSREMVLFETPDLAPPLAHLPLAGPSPLPEVLLPVPPAPPRSLPTAEHIDHRYRTLLVKLAQWQPLTDDDRAIMLNLARAGDVS
jgi:lysozyme